MTKAIWKDIVLAESNKTLVIEGNFYFPPDSINPAYFTKSDNHTHCPWKGTASYYDIEVNGQVNKNAAWYYPSPKPGAKNITNDIAFWKGVRVED